MFVSLVISVLVSLAASLILAPKAQIPSEATQEDFSVPEVQDGSPIPIVFGTVYIEAANVAWYGDLKITPIR